MTGRNSIKLLPGKRIREKLSGGSPRSERLAGNQEVVIRWKQLAAGLMLCFLFSPAFAQTLPDREEDHKPTILGLAIGMTAQQVLARLGRMPDARKDEKQEAIVYWKLQDGSLLQVSFRGEHVCHLGLQFKKIRPATDLWLEPLAKGNRVGLYGDESAAAARVGLPVGSSSLSSESALTAPDPRLHREYKAAESLDKFRTIWTRQEKTEDGYRVETRFLSCSKNQCGDRFQEFVQYKYVDLVPDDIKKFERAVQPCSEREAQVPARDPKKSR